MGGSRRRENMDLVTSWKTVLRRSEFEQHEWEIVAQLFENHYQQNCAPFNLPSASYFMEISYFTRFVLPIIRPVIRNLLDCKVQIRSTREPIPPRLVIEDNLPDWWTNTSARPFGKRLADEIRRKFGRSLEIYTIVDVTSKSGQIKSGIRVYHEDLRATCQGPGLGAVKGKRRE